MKFLKGEDVFAIQTHLEIQMADANLNLPVHFTKNLILYFSNACVFLDMKEIEMEIVFL